MKFSLKNLVAIVALLLSPAVFAVAPVPPAPPQGTPPPDLPIDQYLIGFIGMALVFAFYSFKKKTYIK